MHPPEDEAQDPVRKLAQEDAAAVTRVFEFTHAGQPERLDIVLNEQVPDCSRAHLKRLIEEGNVTLTPALRPLKASRKLPAGTRVRLVIPPPRKIDLSPQNIPLEVLYEDQHLAVIDKPAGLTVHPAPHETAPTLVNALLYKLRGLSSIGGKERPGIVHRLDKETSGVLVVAKNDSAHHGISSQFKERTVHKTYLAIVRGEPREDEGRINLPLGRSYTHPKKQMIRVDGSGREALTDFRVLEKYRGYSFLEVKPHTGRTHQIRVHLLQAHTPVACDKIYGRETAIYASQLSNQARPPKEIPLISRHALHATTISLRHPHTGEALNFTAKLPPDIQALLKALNRYRVHR